MKSRYRILVLAVIATAFAVAFPERELLPFFSNLQSPRIIYPACSLASYCIFFCLLRERPYNITSLIDSVVVISMSKGHILRHDKHVILFEAGNEHVSGVFMC